MLTYENGALIRALANNVDTSIGAGTIRNDVLAIQEGLAGDRCQTIRQRVSTIPCRCNDGNRKGRSFVHGL